MIFGRQHTRTVELPNGVTIEVAVLNTEKGGCTVPAIFPITPELERIMTAGPTIVCGAGGRPFTKEAFGNEFCEACKAPGVPGSSHGLRKLPRSAQPTKGATTAQMRALFGWTTGDMRSLYTNGADRLRLAIEGAMVLANKTPSPKRQARERERKSETKQ